MLESRICLRAAARVESWGVMGAGLSCSAWPGREGGHCHCLLPSAWKFVFLGREGERCKTLRALGSIPGRGCSSSPPGMCPANSRLSLSRAGGILPSLSRSKVGGLGVLGVLRRRSGTSALPSYSAHFHLLLDPAASVTLALRYPRCTNILVT